MRTTLAAMAVLAMLGTAATARAQNAPASTSGAYGGTNGTMGNTLSNRHGNLGGQSTHAGEIAGTDMNGYSASTTRTGQSNRSFPNHRPAARQFGSPAQGHGPRNAGAGPGGSYGSNF